MRAVISTNGTLISKEKARELKSVGLSYVGISLDGLEAVHDHFRGVPGSFKKALEGIANCQAEGLKVGLRFTINKRNVAEIPGIFRLLEDLEVPRACFYHLVYSGRGSELIKEDLDHAETRQVLDLIMDETRALFDKGKPKEILTVDNHADGPYVWMRLKREDPKRAEEVFELLQYNEGNNSGRGIGCISWDGQVHADQFWRNHTFGNVLERPSPPSGTIRPSNCCTSSRTRNCTSRAAAPSAVSSISAAATSAPAPKPTTATNGRRTRPATSPTRRSACSVCVARLLLVWGKGNPSALEGVPLSPSPIPSPARF